MQSLHHPCHDAYLACKGIVKISLLLYTFAFAASLSLCLLTI